MTVEAALALGFVVSSLAAMVGHAVGYGKGFASAVHAEQVLRRAAYLRTKSNRTTTPER